MRSGFWRSVVLALGGTAVAQLIPIFGSLVLARQYAPAQFGLFSAWLGVVLLLAVSLTGRFETALAIEEDGEPRRLVVISTLLTAVLVACTSFVILAIFVAAKLDLLHNVSTLLMGSAIPTAFSIATTQTWQSWAAAEGRYRVLSVMRVAQAATVTLLQIGAGIFFASAEALAISYLAGVMIGIGISAFLMPLGAVPKGGLVGIVRGVWARHCRFPLFSLPADAINTAAAQLPLLIIASRFGADIAGLLAMTMRTLGAPIGLLGKSVLDVFKRHAATSFRERGECRSDYIRTFRVLMMGSLLFCAVMLFFSEHLFAMAFGETWRRAGTIATWLLPMFALRFVASPLSYMVYIAEKQHVDLVWQIALLGITIASLYIPTQYEAAIKIYSAAYSLLYIVYLAMSYRFSWGEKQ